MKNVTFPQHPVLLVDDEEQFLISAGMMLSSHGVTNVLECNDSRKVMGILQKNNISTIVLDVFMPHISGLELLEKICNNFPEIPVIMLTAVNEVNTAVQCMKSGALDYIVKPVDDTRLVTAIKRAVELRQVRNENKRLKKYLLSDELEHESAFEKIITQNSNMHSIFKYVEAISYTNLPVLITGETGVGKELLSRAIHTVSGRKGAFIPVNVAGVDDNLFSDTLFGHKKGAFTGAEMERKGLIEKALGGTLFLDEIGDLSYESQIKLLRLLQEGKYYPIGSDMPKLSDARIVVATNADLSININDGKFRKDLYYRLQTHHLHIPPLRDRKDDLIVLVDHFLEKAAKNLKKKKPSVPKELFILLRNYNFPGNIRELEGMIFDALSRHKAGILSLESFRDKLLPISNDNLYLNDVEITGSPENEKNVVFPDQLPTIKEIEQELIDEALKRSSGNQTIAARILGISRRALNNRIHRT
ncbi:MAG: sigma-54-dependent transcriptional regulator [Calditrichaceae bacterium]